VFRNQTVTIGQMYEMDTGLDRGQLRVVCEAAADSGYGIWDHAAQAMQWHQDRADPQQHLGV
jgi:hypothetical protein